MSTSRAKSARQSHGPVSKKEVKVLRRFMLAASIPDTMRLHARATSEASMIATALQDAPALDREAMGAEMFPFNAIASSHLVRDVVAKIVRRRLPDSEWPNVHAAMVRTDPANTGGYAAYTDAFRDVAFLVGVDYALRSVGALPEWWSQFIGLDEATRDDIGTIVRYKAAQQGGAR